MPDILLTAVIFLVIYFIVTVPLSFISKEKHPLIKSGIEALKLPIAYLLFALLVIEALFTVASHYDWQSPLSQSILNGIAIITSITWFVFRWKKNYIDSLPQKKDHFILGANFFLNLLIIFTALFFFLDLFSIPVAALLTFGGIGGLAVSFAAKDLLSNLFGAIIIHFNGHITVGDFIRSSSKSFEGHVEKISWFHTRLRSLDKTILYVPNATLTESIIENEGKRSHRRLVANIPLSYLDAAKISKLTKNIEVYLKENPVVDNKQDISISLQTFGPYAMELTLYTYLKEINFVLFNQEKQKILLEINKIIKDLEAEFGLETTLSLHQ